MGSKHPYKVGLAGDKSLAVAIIHQAVQEMRDTELQSKKQIRKAMGHDKARLRISAVLWLASTRAAMWFERCDLDQNYALSKMKWAEHAQELLDDKSVLLNCRKMRVLELGLNAVEFIK
jgi:hypothetical protein|tara:strand:+ start:977 stop:1333 length:357 start_codon:yes stop_codon:yes gene_type:complete